MTDELKMETGKIVQWMIHELKKQSDPLKCACRYDSYIIDDQYDVCIEIRLMEKPKTEYQRGLRMFYD